VVAACSKLKVHAIFGLLERDGANLYNAAVLAGAKGLAGRYRKIHLPGLGVDKFVQPGDLGFIVCETAVARIGLNICYDGCFPESSRVMALRGADLVVLPTNWPTGAEEFAEYLVNARSLENHIFSVAVNRVGEERGFRFIGRSRIVDVSGKTLAQASVDREEVIVAEIEPEKARNKRIVRVPGKHEIHRFNDRRPELYGEITEKRAKETAGA
jgi:predicted amidohydrolase